MKFPNLRHIGHIAIAACVVVGLSSCSSDSDSGSTQIEASPFVQKQDLSKDTVGQLISIQSGNVSMAGYDASKQRMTVVFDNGNAYWYQPVDQSVWTSFYNAQPHPWSQVGYSSLVESGIPYGKLN